MQKNSKLIKCPACNHEMSALANACPNCGEPSSAMKLAKVGTGLMGLGCMITILVPIALIIIIVIIAVLLK